MIQLTVDELKSLLEGVVVVKETPGDCSCEIIAAKSHSFEIGKAYLIRTVTMHYTGRVVAITDSDVVLEEAAWIADTGRYSDSLRTGSLGEVEPYPDKVCVCRGGMIDYAEWTHQLPRVQK